jgi:hypothetical protein
MTGGIRRRATAVHDLKKHARLVLIDTGGLGGEPGRQSEMKAETMAQSLAALDAAAVHLTARDARLGRGVISSVARLAEGRVVSTSLGQGRIEGLKPYAERGPFVIGGTSPGVGAPLGVPTVATADAVNTLVTAAALRQKTAVLMLDGPRKEAAEIAREFPSLGAIVYRRSGWPTDQAERVGKVLLLSPGEHGKAIVRVNFDGRSFSGYTVSRLGPQYGDDPTITRYYRTYLGRVDAAHLLDQVPRSPSPEFAGSRACATCHAEATNVWLKSGHAHALATLEKDGHGRDPDCVSCHVTGLTKEGGFKSRLETPDFAFVGCESCHGPAAAHAKDPKASPLSHLGDKVCTTCHTPEQSPRFDFLTYWKKIAHK